MVQLRDVTNVVVKYIDQLDK